MSYWENKNLEEKYKMINVFEKQLDDLKEIVPSFYVANATCHFDEHSPHLHIVGVPVKENCKTGLSKQVGKTSIFTKESLVIIQDKMREKCIEEFNNIYELDSKLKEKQKGKNKDYTPYETSVYKGYKQDKIEMRGDRAEMSDFPLYLNTVAGGLDRRDQTIGGFSFVVKIYAVPVVEIIG